MKPTIDIGYGAKGLVLWGERALLLQEPNGNYDLPGGRLEKGEGCKGGLKREVLEETGLPNLIISESYVPWSFLKRSGLWVVGITFLCWYLDGHISLGFEHSTYDWVPMSHLKGLDIYWKYGLDKFRFDLMEQSSERREAYGGLECRRIAAGNGGRI